MYEVFVNNRPTRLVGSTTQTLAQRRRNGYTKRFGPTVELHLVREVSRPDGYSDSDFNFYLKACEAMDIARKKTYQEHGGLNKISPLVQALGHPMLEAEMGRVGGHIAVKSGQIYKIGSLPQSKAARRENGKKLVENGHFSRITTSESCARGGSTGGATQGRKNVETGHIIRIATAEGRAKGGRKTADSGYLATARCKRWNINRGTPCVCGQHVVQGGLHA